MVNNLRNLTANKLVYTVAMFGLGLCSATVVQWIMFYYAPPKDMGATVYLGAAAVGTAMALGRLVDAWIDPVIGYFSDRSRLRLGRRKPFMAVSIPLFVIAFMALWYPPTAGPSLLNVLWVAGTLGLFFISFSLYAVPYLALLPELADHHHERVLLALVQSIWFACGAGAATLAPPLLAGLIAFPHLPALWAVIAAFTLALPLLTVRERPPQCPVSATATPRQVLRSVRRDRPLFIWAFTLFFIWSGLCIMVKLFPYLHAYLPVELVALPWWLIALTLGAILLGLCAGYRATTVYGIRNTFLGCLMVSGVLILVLAAVDSLWRPSSPPIFFWVMALVVMPAAVLPVALQNAVTAEIALRHREREGIRQEALLFAVQGLAAKLALATGAIALGVTLDLVGYSLEGASGMRAGYALAGMFLLAAAAGMRHYPANRDSRASSATGRRGVGGRPRPARAATGETRYRQPR